MRHALTFKKQIIETLTCSICSDVYCTIHRCENGHGTCSYCFDQIKDRTCAMCRTDMDDSVDMSLSVLSKSCGFKVSCGICDRKFPLSKVEFHRKWCPMYKFMCPLRDKCMHTMCAHEMIDHLMHHDQDVYTMGPSDKLLFSCTNRILQHFLIVVKDVVVVVQTVGQRIMYDQVLSPICIQMKAYYTSEHPTWLTATIRHHHPRQHDTIMETFFIDRIPAVTALTENNCTGVASFLSPKAISKDASIIYKPQISSHCARVMQMLTKTMAVEEWNYDKRYIWKRNWEEVAFVTLSFNFSNTPIHV